MPWRTKSDPVRLQQVAIICIITFLATFSVVCGLRKGLLPFSLLTFTLGNLLLFMLVLPISRCLSLPSRLGLAAALSCSRIPSVLTGRCTTLRCTWTTPGTCSTDMSR